MYKFNIFNLLISFMISNFFSNTAYGQVPDFLDSSYVVVFQDEFTGNSLDQNKWKRLYDFGPSFTDTSVILMDTATCGYPANTYGNYAYDEWNYSDTNLLKINNGSAKILVKKQNYNGQVWKFYSCPSSTCNTIDPMGPIPCDPSNTFCIYYKPTPFKYVTTFLHSKEKFKYGYFEIKFKLPPFPSNPQNFNGVGPNFWLYSADSWSDWSEIDIYEIHGATNGLTNNIFYSTASSTVNYSQGTNVGNFSANVWHTAGALWTNSNIEFYFDGVKVNQIWNSNIKADSLAAMPLIAGINVTFNNFYGWCDTVGTTTSLPYSYEIDYIKVWQQKEACDTTKTYCTSLNQNTYESKIYSSVTIGGTGCNDSVTNKDNLAILGSNYVELKEGFSIDNNSKILMNVKSCITPTVIPRPSSGNEISQPPAMAKERLRLKGL